MKKLFLLPLFSLLFLACSVEELELQENQNGLNAQYTESVDFCEALSKDVFVEICSDEIKNPTVRGFRSFYQAQVQLHTDLPLTGTFIPSPERLLIQYNESNGFGLFKTTYTVNTEECSEVSIEVAVEIQNCQVIKCELFQQDEYSQIYTESKLLALINGDIMNLKPLWLDLLEEGAPINGGFNDSKIVDLYNYYRAEKKAGSTSIDLTYNYSVIDGDCKDSADLTITVCLQDCPIAEPVCNLLLQESYSENYTESEVLSLIDGNVLNLKQLWLNLLEDGAPQNGKFEDSRIIELYNYYKSQKRAGQNPVFLTYPYSLKNGDCEDSADLTLVINPNA